MTGLPCPVHDADGITLYQGNSTELLPLLPRADHWMTDPPYADETHKGARTGTVGGDGVRSLLAGEFASTTADEIRAMFSLAPPKRWLISFMDWHHVLDIDRTPPNGLTFVRFGMWVKTNGCPQFTGDRPSQGWEAIAILHADETRKKWNGHGGRAVWQYPKINGEHKTQKPLPLVKKIMSQFCDRGDLIVDPYCGAGTTLLAARDLGMRAIGIELDPKWANVARRRLSQPLLPWMNEA